MGMTYVTAKCPAQQNLAGFFAPLPAFLFLLQSTLLHRYSIFLSILLRGNQCVCVYVCIKSYQMTVAVFLVSSNRHYKNPTCV